MMRVSKCLLGCQSVGLATTMLLSAILLLDQHCYLCAEPVNIRQVATAARAKRAHCKTGIGQYLDIKLQ